jgi:hypothetical protein
VASAVGKPYLVPLSFHWNGEAMIVTTPRSSRTARNFAGTGQARAAIGQTRGERSQAWRGDDAEELRDRDLMREGVFL